MTTTLNVPDAATAADERRLIAAYLRHMATLRPAASHELRVIASDIDAKFHLDQALNPEAGKLNGAAR